MMWPSVKSTQTEGLGTGNGEPAAEAYPNK
jgi:hypothetical protein